MEGIVADEGHVFPLECHWHYADGGYKIVVGVDHLENGVIVALVTVNDVLDNAAQRLRL